MHLEQVLGQFEATLKNQVAQLQSAAKGSAPGGVGDWEDVVRHFGLTGLERAERVREAGRRGHTRGAFPEEFEAVVHALAVQAHQVLTQLHGLHAQTLATDPNAAARFQKLGTKVQKLASEQRKAYEDAIKPKTGTAGLAGIFANAAATSKLTPWANLDYDTHLTLSCPGCGSPQRTRLTFDCEYCGSSLFAGK